ncbi:MAG: heat-inducible transcription repressor HrcA [Deltaproteobacteria bacterium]|nr:heat-inducible transcription repressor HrcA [Deltaproteobacteria bacterium]
MESLNARHQKILAAIVQGYIRSAEPIGSRTIARSSAFDLSPATIRNVMADLEDLGLLCQPHTSAGRIPTDLGFRYYVDHLLQMEQLSTEVRKRIREACVQNRGQVEEILKSGITVLSQLAPYVSVVSLPHFNQTVLKHIRFVRLNDHQVMAVIVSDAGLVQNILFEVEQQYNQDELNRFSNYLNSIIDGLTLEGARLKLLEQMQADKAAYDSLWEKVLVLGQKVFAQGVGDDSDVMIDGKLNILEHPEFADFERMKQIFRAFEEKNTIVKLLEEAQLGEPLQIFIGAENPCEDMRCCSVIMAGYGGEGQPGGQIGVIGPTRMEYSRIIPLVRYTADVINQLISET